MNGANRPDVHRRAGHIDPALAAPDLERLEHAGDHDILLQPGELSQLRRYQRSPRAVDRTLLAPATMTRTMFRRSGENGEC